MRVAADQRRAAARVAGDINESAVGHGDAIAEEFHRAGRPLPETTPVAVIVPEFSTVPFVVPALLCAFGTTFPPLPLAMFAP